MSRIRVLIADDDEEVLLIIAGLLSPEFDVVGAVQDGQELVSTAKVLKPDVIVADISMPEIDGFEAARLIIEDNHDAKIILLTSYDASIFVKKGFEAGILGYVLKTDADDELARAIHDVSQGKRFVSAKITGIVFPDPKA